MNFINNSDTIVYISELALIIPPKGIVQIEKKLGLKSGLEPYKFKVRKKYLKEKN